MKSKINLVAMLLLSVVSIVPIRAQILALQNDEHAPFFFTMVRRDSEWYGRLTASSEAALELLRGSGELEYMVPARGVSPYVSHAREFYIVGVFVHPGRPVYPVVALRVGPTAETVVVSQEHVLTDDSNRRLTLRPWDVRVAEEPVLLDNRYMDWEGVTRLTRFARPISPSEFILETEAGRETATLDRSHFWGRGGTQLDILKAISSRRALYLMASTHNRIVRGMSLFLFLYRDRRDLRAHYTVEIPMTDRSGWVLLWTAGNDEPGVVGNYVADAFLFEAQVRYDLLPAALLSLELDKAFADVSTGFSAAGRHEEFYHTRVYLGSIEGL